MRDQCVVASCKYGGTISLFAMNAGRTGLILSGGLADGVADSDAERQSVVWASGLGGLSDLKMGPDGYLYAVSLQNGTVWRLRPQFPMGDVNRDGAVDGRDVSLFVKVLMGVSTDPLQVAQSDFDGDGLVGSSDLSLFIDSEMLSN